MNVASSLPTSISPADPTVDFSTAPRAEASSANIVSPVDLLHLQARIASQSSRFDAMKALVHWFSERLPEAQVRVAWGGSRPTSLFDHRLGKLGPESSLWNEVVDRWDTLASPSAQAVDGAGGLWVVLPNPHDPSQRAVLWFGPAPGAEVLGPQLQPLAASLGAVLWSRPKRRLFRFGTAGKGAWRCHHYAFVAALLALALVPLQYRVRCHAVVQPRQQRMVAAPFEATLLECHVEPGDEVRKNEVLCVLDGRPLRLELEALNADLSQAMKQQSSALATGKISESQLAALERRQLEKRIELYEDRLARLEVRSPIDGVVVSGDLARSVGSPLEIGQPLLEIAPLEQMLVDIEIPEEEIQYVRSGAEVRVRLDAATRETLDGRLDRVFPQAEVRQEQNVFIGRWALANKDGWLRPGMQGKAVVYGPRRPLVWPWIRRLHEATLRAVGW